MSVNFLVGKVMAREVFQLQQYVQKPGVNLYVRGCGVGVTTRVAQKRLLENKAFEIAMYGNGNKKYQMLALKCCLLYYMCDVFLTKRRLLWDCSKNRLVLFS